MRYYVFPGHPEFQRRAAEALRLDPSIAEGRALAPLSTVASLCAQAAHSGPADVAAILAEAAAYRDRLRVAARAAELMLDEVAERCGGVPRPPAEAAPEVALRPARAAKPRP